MIYYVLYELLYNHFKEKDWFLIKALNVFQYVTFRTAYASVTALLLSLVFGGKLIQALRRWDIGQQIREEGPQGHMAKRGTPTMGGVLIVGSVGISTLLWARLSSVYVWIVVITTLGFGAIGFADDYYKMARQRSLGLTGKQKLLAQFLIAVGVWVVLFMLTKYFASDYSWNVSIPFLKATADPNGISYIGPYLYLDLTHRPEAAELTVFCGAMAGASLGFLWYNAPPAEVFMGDVGSLAIGGAIGTVSILTKQEFMLVMVGGVFVIEALSVMLQVGVFKMTKRTTGTGRRLFKMTPLHHHFEMRDWKESKIVFRFLILAILFALLSLSTLKLR